MDANAAYGWLMRAAAASALDAVDIHVLASIFAVAMDEAGADTAAISDGVGLSGAELMMLAGFAFPGASVAFENIARHADVTIDDEEQSLRDVLLMYASGGRALERPLAAMIARRCKSPHHLWQDLGLRNRGELSALMNRHFATLARRNSGDMKWKKFLYRLVCGTEGFTLCVAPICSDCDDFVNCFGAEDGEARLARARNMGLQTVHM
jgi:nitrogen fixation protein NifQ